MARSQSLSILVVAVVGCAVIAGVAGIDVKLRGREPAATGAATGGAPAMTGAATGPVGTAPVALGGTDHESSGLVAELSRHNAEKWRGVAAQCASIDTSAPKVLDELRADDARPARAQLSQALGARIPLMRRFINKLKGVQTKLYTAIDNVNTLFRLKYDENLMCVKTASEILSSLSHIRTRKYSPVLRAIRNIGEAAPVTMGSANASGVFLEEQSVMALRSSCMQSDNCDTATRDAFALYNLCIELNGKMHDNFERERTVLAKFRDELEALMKKKMQRISQLQTQADKVNSIINNAGHDPLGPVATAFQAHGIAMQGVCPELARLGSADAQGIQQLAAALAASSATGPAPALPTLKVNAPAPVAPKLEIDEPKLFDPAKEPLTPEDLKHEVTVKTLNAPTAQ